MLDFMQRILRMQTRMEIHCQALSSIKESPRCKSESYSCLGIPSDEGILRFEFDFYLQAHAGLQGTVKPTHYTVIYDENKLNADEIQQGTHTSSYLYGRATKAVSLV
jgi:hypothetical protein